MNSGKESSSGTNLPSVGQPPGEPRIAQGPLNQGVMVVADSAEASPYHWLVDRPDLHAIPVEVAY
jgi:hypothetical protein